MALVVSYKLHVARARVRITLEGTDAGVDLLGLAASPIFAAARPLAAWLVARDPEALVRAYYIHPQIPRCIVSLEPPRGQSAKPWVLRLDGPDAAAFLSEAPDLSPLVEQAAEEALRRRASAPTPGSA